MENATLKKKLSTYVSEGGYLKNVSEEVLYDLLIAWEEWTGSAKEFYKSIGHTHKQMASLIGKAKKLKREGYFGNKDFKELQIEGGEGLERGSASTSNLIEIEAGGKVIRFPSVDQLLEYLKKVG